MNAANTAEAWWWFPSRSVFRCRVQMSIHPIPRLEKGMSFPYTTSCWRTLLLNVFTVWTVELCSLPCLLFCRENALIWLVKRLKCYITDRERSRGLHSWGTTKSHDRYSHFRQNMSLKMKFMDGRRNHNPTNTVTLWTQLLVSQWKQESTSHEALEMMELTFGTQIRPQHDIKTAA